MARFKRLSFLGFPHYGVTDDGRVYSRRIYGSKVRSIGSWWKMKLMGKKYAHVNLFKEVGKPIRYQIQWLVAMAFIGPRPEGMLVLHKDDDGRNNRIENLYYGTSKNNAEDALRNGKRPLAEKVYNASLTNDQVKEVWRLRRKGHKPRPIARRLGIRYQTVYKILAGEIYKSVDRV